MSPDHILEDNDLKLNLLPLQILVRRDPSPARFLCNFQKLISLHTEKTFLPKWLEITSSSIFPAIWAGFSYWNSRKTVIPALRAQKSCPNSRKNWAGSNFKPFWQECFFSCNWLSFGKWLKLIAITKVFEFYELLF